MDKEKIEQELRKGFSLLYPDEEIIDVEIILGDVGNHVIIVMAHLRLLSIAVVQDNFYVSIVEEGNNIVYDPFKVSEALKPVRDLFISE